MSKFLYLTPFISSYTISRLNAIRECALFHGLDFQVVELNSKSYFYSHANPERDHFIASFGSGGFETCSNLSFDTSSFLSYVRKLYILAIDARKSSFIFFVGYNNIPLLVVLLVSLFRLRGRAKPIAILGIDSRAIDVRFNCFIVKALKSVLVSCFDYAFAASRETILYLEGLGHSRRKSFIPYYLSASPITLCPDRQKENEIIVVARLVKRKNIQTLLAAYSMFVFHMHLESDSIPRLRIIGDGPERQNLEMFVHVNHLNNYVSFMYDQPNLEVIKYLTSSIVSIIPSLSDQFGICVLEALACNTPVLCSMFVGSSECIVEGLNGYLFDPYSAEDICHTLIKFFARPLILSSEECYMANRLLMQNYSAESFAFRLNHIISQER